MEDRLARLNLEIIKAEQIPDGSRSVAKLLQDWGLGKQPQECMWVIAYDNIGTIRTVIEVARGTHTSLEVHIPSVLTAVLATGSGVFTTAHNHPQPGNVTPSQADYKMNQALMDAANACGLVYEEHLIVCPTAEYYSFVDAGLLIPASRGGGKPFKRAASSQRKETR